MILAPFSLATRKSVTGPITNWSVNYIHSAVFQVKPYDYIAADAKIVAYNPTVEQMYAPQLGPSNPFKTQQAAAQKNMFCGFVENTGVSQYIS